MRQHWISSYTAVAAWLAGILAKTGIMRGGAIWGGYSARHKYEVRALVAQHEQAKVAGMP